jgi:hypothetical protein
MRKGDFPQNAPRALQRRANQQVRIHLAEHVL